MGAHPPASLESDGLQGIKRSLPSVVPVADSVRVICIRDWEIEQRGIARHAEGLAESATTIARAVDFAYVELALGLVDLVEFVPDRRESLAVTAPWGEEVNEPRPIREEPGASLC